MMKTELPNKYFKLFRKSQHDVTISSGHVFNVYLTMLRMKMMTCTCCLLLLLASPEPSFAGLLFPLGGKPLFNVVV
jgi:hypothetical protein